MHAVTMAMNRRILRSLLLAGMLLLVQIGGLAHASTHLVKSQDGHAPAGSCAWCAAYSNVDGPAPDAKAAPLPPAPDLAPSASSTSQPNVLAIRLAFRSQAPPRS
jgi:hypothetical protein